MMYNLLVAGAMESRILVSVLASSFDVSVADVDVSDSFGDPDLRNWEAAVSCQYSALRGDLSWGLDIYAQEFVADPPSESVLAQHVATATELVVLFPAESMPPSAYWAATPEGNNTRVRLYESDEEAPVYVVDAVEIPVRQLPNAKVTRIPEVVRELRIPTPITDSFREQMPAHFLAQRGPEWKFSDGLAAWEMLVAHMASGWAGSGWCPPDIYRERLAARDGLTTVPHTLPPPAAAVLQQGLQRLDSTYTHLTTEDPQGSLIGMLLGAEARDRQLGWWWHRRPEPLPW
ncbi:hypothetical protein AB0C61_36325 [Streptomyces sp. NPDC048680]|uniref:hypothetical protein n=1 Tax=Streptomyces sp. NPDC048680 TaxID=3155492 RepID=UPI0034481818